eukprot:6469083-Amphidinium_carterae.1
MVRVMLANNKLYQRQQAHANDDPDPHDDFYYYDDEDHWNGNSDERPDGHNRKRARRHNDPDAHTQDGRDCRTASSSSVAPPHLLGHRCHGQVIPDQNQHGSIHRAVHPPAIAGSGAFSEGHRASNHVSSLENVSACVRTFGRTSPECVCVSEVMSVGDIGSVREIQHEGSKVSMCGEHDGDSRILDSTSQGGKRKAKSGVRDCDIESKQVPVSRLKAKTPVCQITFRHPVQVRDLGTRATHVPMSSNSDAATGQEKRQCAKAHSGSQIRDFAVPENHFAKSLPSWISFESHGPDSWVQVASCVHLRTLPSHSVAQTVLEGTL